MELKQPQVTALLAWLHGGGRLVVAVEQPGDVNAVDWLQQLLPCELGAVATNTPRRSGLQEWPTGPPDLEERNPIRSSTNTYARLNPDSAFEQAPMSFMQARLRDGDVLAGTPQQPLLNTAPRAGRGELVVALFSPELEPFRSWPNRLWFWAEIAHVPGK